LGFLHRKGFRSARQVVVLTRDIPGSPPLVVARNIQSVEMSLPSGEYELSLDGYKLKARHVDSAWALLNFPFAFSDYLGRPGDAGDGPDPPGIAPGDGPCIVGPIAGPLDGPELGRFMDPFWPGPIAPGDGDPRWIVLGPAPVPPGPACEFPPRP
jgi:hypothetical protein